MALHFVSFNRNISWKSDVESHWRVYSWRLCGTVRRIPRKPDSLTQLAVCYDDNNHLTSAGAAVRQPDSHCYNLQVISAVAACPRSLALPPPTSSFVCTLITDALLVSHASLIINLEASHLLYHFFFSFTDKLISWYPKGSSKRSVKAAEHAEANPQAESESAGDQSSWDEAEM